MIREDLAYRWYQAIFSRYSVRAYDGRAVPWDMEDEIAQLMDGFHRCATVREQCCWKMAQKRSCGFLGAFGKIRGADMLLVLIGEASYPNHEVAVDSWGRALFFMRRP